MFLTIGRRGITATEKWCYEKCISPFLGISFNRGVYRLITESQRERKEILNFLLWLFSFLSLFVFIKAVIFDVREMKVERVSSHNLR